LLRKSWRLTRYSSEIAEDSEPSVAEVIADEIAYAFSMAEDLAGWNGDGTSAYAGIRGFYTWQSMVSTMQAK